MTGRQSIRCAVERMLWRGVFMALAAVFLTVLLPVLWDLFSPFLIGLAVAALLRPLIALTQEKLHMRRGVAVGLWVALAVLAALWLVYWICSFVVVQLTVATPGVVTGVVDMLRTASERLLDMAQTLPSAIGNTLRTSLNSAFQSLSEAGMQFAGNVVNGALSVVASLPYAFVYANFLLLAVIFVLGGVLFAVIQYAPAAYYQGKWPLAGLAAACAAALLAMAQLGEGVLVMLLVIACEVLIGVLTLHGGRRTAFGDEIVAQALGYRKFLRRVTQSQLQSRLAQDSQYFYRILPYAEAMGLGRSLARTLGDTALEQCDWYQGAKPVPRTAAGFYSSLREALSLMEMSIRN